ncbi:hypothetical protein PXK56_18495 [Phaeobacter gallaeciensis]|uniref:hypothetical protein n=1 Tax=Phaeobacter gallaeciensis TaxID=60890 RepID=UPI00238086F3|nr:hypothetical protein [Phaeobacter gallaeciensis]MDE4297177.1 hypothetical protein [Phaeobacter gallaeciensis]
MGLRDDIEAMERHSRNGTLKEWFEGTAPQLPSEPMPSDPSAAHPAKNTYRFLAQRGD